MFPRGFFLNLAFTLLALALSLQPVSAQDLAPRAYLVAPVHSNAITLTNAFYSGNILLDGASPITGAKATVNIPVLTYSHSMRFFGRSANFNGSLPYGVGHFRGTVVGAEANAYRSGLLDASFRFSVNLVGGPAMDLREFSKWRQKTLVGVSFKVVVPSGQYDPTRLVNFGTNRWAFKPEVGFSRRRSHWLVDTYGAAWFFTTNPEYFSHNQFNPGVITQTQSPTGAFEGHLSYDVGRRLWASLDGNFWFGGATKLNGVVNPLTTQRNSRIGATVSIPLKQRQSLKFSYNDGAYIRYGGNYQTVSAAWQYTWFDKSF